MSEKHPSFGLVKFSRATVGTRKGEDFTLFGSRLKNHRSVVSLTLHEASRTHQYGEDHFYPDKRIISVDLSTAQFAELITTLNIGAGVPCTIRSVGGTPVEPPKDGFVQEHQRAREAFTDRMKNFGSEVADDVQGIKDILEKDYVGKGAREEIRKTLDHIVRKIEKDIPFALETFEEAAERVVSASKAEVDSFLSDATKDLDLLKSAMKGPEATEKALIETENPSSED